MQQDSSDQSAVPETDHQKSLKREELLEQSRLASWGKVNRYRLDAVRDFAGNSVLDVGCSSGGYVSYLRQNGYAAFGVDLLEDEIWRKSANQAFCVGSATDLPFPADAVDSVLAFETLEHVPDVEKALTDISRVCRKNAIVTVPDCELPEDLLRAGLVYAHWRDRSHVQFFTADTLRSALDRAGFRVEYMTRINPIRPDYLPLRSFHLPTKVAAALATLMRRTPLRKKYYMTLLAVASKC